MESTNGTNSTKNSVYAHPTLKEYYTNMPTIIIFSILIAALLTIWNIFIYFTTISKLQRHLEPRFLSLSTKLCSIYPIISLLSLIVLLAPKTWFICHSLQHLSFTLAAIIFHRLCFLYLHPERNYLAKLTGVSVKVNTPPCCCCCVCLPKVTPTKRKHRLVRYMVSQMFFVQGVILLLLNGIYIREPELFGKVSHYFIPPIFSSILIGLWGLNITVGFLTGIYPNYALRKKMVCVVLIALLGKLQFLILNSQLDHLTLGGSYPINHIIYKQTFINLLILGEFVLISLLAQDAYNHPTIENHEALMKREHESL